ncbi:hypothetical protein NUW58_g2271 [Xylaria curta]|uniref:Uncharacterized protein n=1 Tax=Xylaria curta TaxID=42375 RepID=A0ACC1PGF0_9PEZI|nr:hypothetical protein NUW58_g2271 [Xylaria curta]
MASSTAPLGTEAVPCLLGRKERKDEAIRDFRKARDPHGYSSPFFLSRFLELKLPELPYDTHPGCSSHTLLLIPEQTYETEGTSFLSILCAECRYHFHLETDKAHTRDFEDTNHPSHMLIPFSTNSQYHKHKRGEAEFICAVPDCFYTIKITTIPPKLSTKQIIVLQDDQRIIRNLQYAQTDDPQRFSDMSPNGIAGSAIPILAKYVEDRLAKPSDEVLKIKKRNKKFSVLFGQDCDDLLRFLGFEEKSDEEGEECWYITAPEPVTVGSPHAAHSRRALLQDTLAELRTLFSGSATTPAWGKLIEAIPGYLPRHETIVFSPARPISEEDTILLGCLKDSSPMWFSWAALLLASLCPSRRDDFLDAGLRCIQERSEDASLSIIMYKSQFDQVPSVDNQVQAAFDFLGLTLEDGKDTHRILSKYRTMIENDTSDLFRAEASQQLEIISNHLGADLLGEVARGDSLTLTPTSNGRRMSIRSATRLLNVEADYNAQLIRDCAATAEQFVDREKVVEALEVLSDLKKQQGQHAEAQNLREAAEFIRATGNASSGQFYNSAGPEVTLTTDPANHTPTPPGLKNIGNTCYLNSLLQYFYNVKPIREMVLDYNQIQLELSDASVASRRTGGNGTQLTLEEAIVARQFVEELHRLFSELQTTMGAAASPSQKLANTALSSAKEILTSPSQNQPPPLPARPPLVPPSSPGKEVHTMNVAREPSTEYHIARTDSSRTLVDELNDTETEAHTKAENDTVTPLPTSHAMTPPLEDQIMVELVEDTTMEEVPPPLSLEEKFSQISQRLEQSDRSGTSQQDVEEIIGNILEHLMRAIRPDGPMGGRPNLQADKITELFFTTIVNRTIKTKTEDAALTSTSPIDEDILNEEVVPERWITAFPHPDKTQKMKNNLYEALDRYFSYELLSGSSLARYTTIRALPPIVHICIQRSDASGVKNKNPVIIPEDLYLDRYMEAAAGSDLWNTRRRVWALKERIKELESRKFDLVENVFRAPVPHASHTYAPTYTEKAQYPEDDVTIDWNSELWRDLLPLHKRGVEAAQLNPATGLESAKRTWASHDSVAEDFNFSKILWETGQRVDEADFREISDLKREEANAFSSMKQHKYCLHAMICHGGGMHAGHYWVWVRDFKNQVWYKYNDSLVTKDSRDSQQVIDELNNSGDPYYVAYVRDELKDDLVEVPQRAQSGEDDYTMNVAEELEIIDSIAIDTPPQPANSPVNAPVPEAVMEDAPTIELKA